MDIGIIGSAGRRGDGAKVTRQAWSAAAQTVLALVAPFATAGPLHLHSGGAAFADHLAVILPVLLGTATPVFLHLYFPCRLTEVGFEDTGIMDWRRNPGGALNRYHYAFSRALGCVPGTSLGELNQVAHEANTRVEIHFGFHSRNAAVARAAKDVLIATTFAERATDDIPDGGTAHTWSLSQAPRKIHVALTPVLHNFPAESHEVRGAS